MIILLSFLDALLTLKIIALGGKEVNQFMEILLKQSEWWFISIKMSVTILGYTILKLTHSNRVLTVLTTLYSFLIIYEVGIIWVYVTEGM